MYFLSPKAPFASMGELALVSNEMVVPIPDDISTYALRRLRPAAWPHGSP